MTDGLSITGKVTVGWLVQTVAACAASEGSEFYETLCAGN